MTVRHRYDDARQLPSRRNGTTTSYSYDAASRLSQLVENIGGTAHDFTLGFSHNPASQIASNTRSNDAYAWTDHYNVSRGYTANGLNQYTASGAVNPTYDGRGNLIQAGGPAYLYNAENRLRSASGQAELFYDPAGRLVQVSAPWSRWYGYDGPNLLLENNGGVENPYDRRFVFGPGTDEALVWYEGSGTSDRRWLHADERGSIVAVTNGSGSRDRHQRLRRIRHPGCNPRRIADVPAPGRKRWNKYPQNGAKFFFSSGCSSKSNVLQNESRRGSNRAFEREGTSEGGARMRRILRRGSICLALAGLAAAAAYASETVTYSYDARGRLVKVERAGTVNNGVAATYQYDKADNRKNVTVTGSPNSPPP